MPARCTGALVPSEGRFQIRDEITGTQRQLSCQQYPLPLFRDRSLRLLQKAAGRARAVAGAQRAGILTVRSSQGQHRETPRRLPSPTCARDPRSPSHLPCAKPWAAAASWGPKARSSERRDAGQRACPLPWPRISLKARGLRLRAASAPPSTVLEPGAREALAGRGGTGAGAAPSCEARPLLRAGAPRGLSCDLDLLDTAQSAGGNLDAESPGQPGNRSQPVGREVNTGLITLGQLCVLDKSLDLSEPGIY